MDCEWNTLTHFKIEIPRKNPRLISLSLSHFVYPVTRSGKFCLLNSSFVFYSTPYTGPVLSRAVTSPTWGHQKINCTTCSKLVVPHSKLHQLENANLILSFLLMALIAFSKSRLNGFQNFLPFSLHPLPSSRTNTIPCTGLC